ncbi:hypothetical protein ACKWTF_000982 [Chironomus riparius]
MLLHYLFILGTVYLSLAQEKKVVCYWNSDSDRHNGLRGYFKASDIDPNICTHIIYRSIFYSQQLALYWSPQNIDKSAEFLNLKATNPNVKLLIGVGGPYWGSMIPSNITSTPTGQENLAKAIKSFLDSHPGFNGADFDWQWPGHSGYLNDKDNFASFLSTLRRIITSQKILSISVAPRNEDIEKSYDIPKIINQVDFINLNSFDLRGYITDTATAFHSPYRKNQSDRSPESEWNAVSIVTSWKTRNVPTEKLTLGIPTYGRSFTLSDANDNDVDSSVAGLGRPSSFAPQTNDVRKNIIPYSEICYNLNQEATSWESRWSQTHFTPYATYDVDQWVGYDDKLSVLAKIHLVLEHDLAGINYAALDHDDFSGYCDSIKFPLIRLGYNAIINGIFEPNPVEPTTITPRPGETTPLSTTTTTEEVTPEITTMEPEITTTTTEEPTTSSTTTSSTSTSSTTTSSSTTTTSSTTTSTTSLPITTTTETPTTETEAETSPETSSQSSSTTSTTSKPSTVPYSTTTRTTTSEIPTPPVTPDRTTVSASEVSTTVTSSQKLEQFTTTQQATDQSTTETEASTSTTDFKTPPVTPTPSISSSTTEGGSNGGNSTNAKESTTFRAPTEDDSNISNTTDSTEVSDSGEDNYEGSSDYSSSEEDETTYGDVDETTISDLYTEETTNGDGAPGIPDNNSTIDSDGSTDDVTQDITDTTTLSSSTSTKEPEIITESSSIITEESTASTGQSTALTEQSTASTGQSTVSNDESTTSKAQSTVSIEESTTSKRSTAVPSNFICPIGDGNFKNPTDCTTFFICSNWYPHLFYCQPGLYYDEVCDCCDYQSVVECNVN